MRAHSDWGRMTSPYATSHRAFGRKAGAPAATSAPLPLDAVVHGAAPRDREIAFVDPAATIGRADEAVRADLYQFVARLDHLPDAVRVAVVGGPLTQLAGGAAEQAATAVLVGLDPLEQGADRGGNIRRRRAALNG